ncbi:MAG TPA: hypothetical protein VFM68_01965 [Candidatus Saccharimonadales bacterium]|nr:hypothetical protein [Candidatus Saccharimonadales bacterium]
MSFVIILLLSMAALFGVVFFAKRRFGVLGLALAAGAMVSTLWVGDLTPIIAEAGFVLVAPPLESVVAAALILLPAILLLSSGPSYTTTWQRVSGATLFALLAVSLLLEPLGSALVVEGIGQQVYEFFVGYQVIIITTCLALAIVDVLLTKTPKRSSKH